MNSQGLLVKGKRYQLRTSGSGAPILLLHGFSGDLSTWEPLRQSLQSSFQVIALDLPGHGDSDKPAAADAYRMEGVAADLVALLDQLDLQKAHLLGYSMGGRLALFLALTYPARFRSLILESASPGLACESERRDRRRSDTALAERIERKGIASFVDYWERLPLWATQQRLPAAVLQQQRVQRLRNDPCGLANSLRGMGAGAQPNLWPLLPRLALPTLLLVGACDRKFRRINERMSRQIPNGSLRVVPQAGHNTHLENPSAFECALRSFLERL